MNAREIAGPATGSRAGNSRAAGHLAMVMGLLGQVLVAQAQTTTNAVTWQGQLMHQGQPYNGEVWGEIWFFDDE